MTSVLTIRPASAADLDMVAGFHVHVWRETYRDMAPAAAYIALDADRRRPAWQAKLAEDRPGSRTLLAMDGDQIAGLASFGAASYLELQPGGELQHLYVDPAHARRGIGRRLLTLALAELRTAEYQTAALAVVEQNQAARAFYRAAGGVEDGRFTDPGPLWRSANIVIRWSLDRPEPATRHI